MPKELQYSMFTDIKSIIELASSHQKIIISPLHATSTLDAAATLTTCQIWKRRDTAAIW